MNTQQKSMWILNTPRLDLNGSKPTEFTARQAILRNLLDLDVQKLGFSAAVSRVMRNAHVRTVGELISQTEPCLLRWRGLGKKRVSEIRDRLGLFGLSLGMDTEAADVHPVIELLALSIAHKPAVELHLARDPNAFCAEVDDDSMLEQKAS